MAVLMLAAGLGALNMISANSAQQQEDKAAAERARAYGIKTAGVDFSAEAHANSIVAASAQLDDVLVNEAISIDKAQAKAESDAIVSAAAAGVSGQSTDAVVNDTERTAAEAKNSVADSVKAQQLQFQSDYVDTYLNAHVAKGTANFEQASSSERTTQAAAGFLQGFIGGLL